MEEQFLGILTIILGVAWLIIVARILAGGDEIKKNGHLATGHIVDYVDSSDGDGGKIPVIEFLTAEGEKIKGKPYSTSPRYFHDTDTTSAVEVIYQKDKPSNFLLTSEVSSETGNLIIHIILLGIGVGAIIGGLTLLAP